MGFASLKWLSILVIIMMIINNCLADDELKAGQDHEYMYCEESRCGENEPPIRFPFRLKDSQPSHCGYPGFDLSCTSSDRTALVLPLSKLYVQDIDYVSQEIIVYDPYDCLEVQLIQQIVNLSSNFIHFKYRSRMNNSSYVVFNCSQEDTYRSLCFSSVLLPSNREIQDMSESTLYCTKMYEIESLPDDLYMLWKNAGLSFSLTWSKPDCRGCEAEGKRCKLTKHAGAEHDETECFNVLEPRKGISKIALAIVATIGLLICCSLAVGATFYIHSLVQKDKENRLRIEKFLEDYTALIPSRYTYADIKKITTGFKDKLGQGAYGMVFKDKLSNDIVVAVKILNISTKENGEEFINEVATLARIHHVNVVRLVGYCAEGVKRALVYEFMPNGSLDKFLSSAAAGGADRSLSWETLHNIALGIAKGIEYLHQGCDQRILHFDIKPHNILLNQNFVPKISDFGLAKLCSKDQSVVSITTGRGTIGYIAPEVFSRNFGNVSCKSDDYSFGMLLLEMVGGRKNTNVTEENVDEIYYPEWVYNLLQEGEDFRILIEEERDAETAKKLAIVGLLCVQWHPISRPTMTFVVQMLEGNKELSVPPNPFNSAAPSKANTKIRPRRMALELEVIAENERSFWKQSSFRLSLVLSLALPLHGCGYIFGSGSQSSLGKHPLI
ncbi:hypothetical protein TIFTF001_021929 [Ficus carica]|uniref:Protein kinase domain-containing protein n=1 Tax=Ficus carica TaxID=3494 RepID=A0AA88AHN8_FICCA|nr:hypothetical protein TIFTF001_021929 [Ficus carica]